MSEDPTLYCFGCVHNPRLCMDRGAAYRDFWDYIERIGIRVGRTMRWDECYEKIAEYHREHVQPKTNRPWTVDSIRNHIHHHMYIDDCRRIFPHVSWPNPMLTYPY